MEKKRSIKWVFIGTGILLIMLIISSGIGLLFILRFLPNLNEQAAAQTRISEFQISLYSPQNNSHWPVYGAIPIRSRLSGSQKVVRQELFINGVLWEDSDGSSEEELSTGKQWSWTPFATGSAVLQVRASSENGMTVLSDPVRVYLDPPSELERYITVDPVNEMSLTDIAESYQTTVEDILDANPGLESEDELTQGDLVYLPIKFDPSQYNFDFTPEQTEPALPVDVMPGIEIKDTTSGQLASWLKNSLGAKNDPPTAPQLQGAVVGCDVQLLITDLSANEDGFRVYRTQANETNSSFIATLQAQSGSATFSYQDTPEAGEVIYSVSAFNSSGVSASNPAVLTLDDAVCGNGTQSGSTPDFIYDISVTPGLHVTQAGIIQFQKTYDLAYLYVTLDKVNWKRFPNIGKYLPGGGEFDLMGYLDSVINSYPQPVLDVEMEIWGWEGWQVVEIGKVSVHVERLVLQVCNKLGESACDINSNSGWVTEVILPDEIVTSDQLYADLKALFKWDSALASQKGVVWQVAYKPYPGPEVANTQGLIISRGWYTPAGKTFTFNLNYLNDDGKGIKLPQWSSYGYDVNTNYFHEVYPPGTPFTLYVRALAPQTNGKSGLTSNTVVLHYQTPSGAEAFEPAQRLASELPMLYDVEFIEEFYTEPILVSNNQWGCVIYDQIVYKTPPLNPFNLPDDADGCLDVTVPVCDGKNKAIAFYPGDKQCPAHWSPPQDEGGLWNDIKELAGGIVNGIKEAVNTVSQALEDIKGQLAQQVAKLIPGCEGNPTCVSAIQSGLEAGFTVLTGVPPNIPNFQELSEKGIAYAVEVAASEIGVDCDDTCKAILEKGIEQAVKTGASQAGSPGCVGDAEAHNHLREKLCIQPGVKYHPAAGAVLQPATISVRVTRRLNVPGEENVSIADSGSYALWLDFPGYNDTRVGDWFPMCGFKEGLTGENATAYTDAGGGYPVKRQINTPLSGALYKSKQINIPWLTPGESIEIPLVLEQEVFWRESHGYDAVNGNLDLQIIADKCGDDWPYLYYEGKTLMNATVLCLNADQQMVSCGADDHLETQNPAPPNY